MVFHLQLAALKRAEKRQGTGQSPRHTPTQAAQRCTQGVGGTGQETASNLMGTFTVSPAGTAGNSEASSAQEAAWKTEHRAGKSEKVGSGSGSAGAKLSESQAPISSHGNIGRVGSDSPPGPHSMTTASYLRSSLISLLSCELALLGFTEKFVCLI